MLLQIIGCSFRNTPLEVREQLAFDADHLPRTLDELDAHYGCEAVSLSTCNRVELYLARPDADIAPGELLTKFLADFHGLSAETLRPHLYHHRQADAVRHLFRVAAGLDSMILGDAQIANQIKRSYELAQQQETVGPLLHQLFQHAHHVGKRVRTETRISRGQVSVAGAAVDHVRRIFKHLHDKTVLVIGAGKMGALTLKHLRALQPQRIWVTNRSPEKAEKVAWECGGKAIPWDKLDEALTRTDIVLSTTGATEPIVTRERYEQIRDQRTGGRVVIFDIAVPRDFDPRIHDGDRTCLFNIDDLNRIREQTLQDRRQHVAPAEAIIEQELQRFFKEMQRRQNGPIIARLTQALQARRQVIVTQLLQRFNGRLTEADQSYVEGAFRSLQNQFLHGPISALAEEADALSNNSHTLASALHKLFDL